MNININYKKFFHFLFFIGIALFVLSCTSQEKDKIDRGIQTFAVFLWEIVNFVIFGLTSLTLSIIVVINRKPILRIIATIFTSIYMFLVIVGLLIVVDIPPPGFYIYMVFFILFFIGAICGVLIFLAKPKDKLAHIEAVEFEEIKDDEMETLN